LLIGQKGGGENLYYVRPDYMTRYNRISGTFIGEMF
jgi:hypothetical protein